MSISRRIVVATATVAVAVAPAAALAGTTTSSSRSQAEKQCRQEQKSMGKTAFDATYGTNKNKSNAFGKCVSHRTTQNSSDQTAASNNAAKQCKTEMNDPNFATNHGGKTFTQYYGSGKTGKDAYGKCVSATAKAQTASTEKSQTTAEENAARQCKAEMKDSSFATNHGGKTFTQYYGTNKNGKNAFGKCVSTTAHTLESGSSTSSPAIAA